MPDASLPSGNTDTTPDVPFRARTVSFVQRSGRLKDRQQRTWDALAPQFVIEPPRAVGLTSVARDYVFDAAAHFGRTASLVVEIGAGHGEAVAHAAAANPDVDYLAIEVYKPGVVQTLQRIRAGNLTNVRIVQADAVHVLRSMLPAASVEELWLFFPDPWHKARHNKRRLVTPAFAESVARVLRPGGTWRLATDWADYARQMREVVAESPLFETELESARFTGRVLTSFERKGLAKDRMIADITATRRA